MKKNIETLNNSPETLNILRNINSNIRERHFHEFTHILYGIRNMLGAELKTYMEIGSYVGSSASLIAKNPYPSNIICIDPCCLNKSHYNGSENQEQTLLHNIKNNNIYNYNITLHKKYSTDADLLQKLKNENTKVDLLFIDGGHSYNDVMNDWNNYENFVNSGGFIVFDDYHDYLHSPDVKVAVDKLIETIDKDKYEIIGSPKNTLEYKLAGYNPFEFSNEFILYKK